MIQRNISPTSHPLQLTQRKGTITSSNAEPREKETEQNRQERSETQHESRYSFVSETPRGLLVHSGRAKATQSPTEALTNVSLSWPGALRPPSPKIKATEGGINRWGFLYRGTSCGGDCQQPASISAAVRESPDRELLPLLGQGKAMG